MKLITFLLLTAVLHVYAPVSCQVVSISGKNLPLEKVFSEIRKQTGLEFIYQSSLLRNTKKVRLNVKRVPVEEVLKICLQGQGLGFNIRNNTIVIFKDDNGKTGGSVTEETPADRTIVVKGRVVDFRGLPVEMASVVLMRTNNGTLANHSGTFNLKVKDLQATDQLKISFVGLKSQVIPLNNRTDPEDIVMQASDNVLDETMVVAYGTSSERFRTGDIAMVKAADIGNTPALNVMEALAGRVPGLYVRQSGSNPGSTYNALMRGFNIITPLYSLFANEVTETLSKPLIVIDGLPMPPDLVTETGQYKGIDVMTGFTGAGGGQDPLYWLNPLDVESVTVLKDAEATALYGSRAANSVLLITTKKGKPGKTNVEINFNTGINAQAKRLKLLNTPQYLAMRHEAWNNSMQAGLPVNNLMYGDSYKPNTINSYDLLVWDTTRYTDWQKVLLGNAPVYNAGLAVSGGEGRTAYRFSGNYNLYKTSFPHVQGNPAFKEEKGSVSLNVNTRSSNNRMKLTSSVMASTATSYQPGSNPEPFIFLAPDAPSLFDPEGNLNFYPWRPAGPVPNNTPGNPLEMLAKPYRANRFTMMFRTSLSYELFSSLVLAMGAGYLRSDGEQSMIRPRASTDPGVLLFVRQADFGKSNSTGFNVEPNLQYKARWSRHYLHILAGVSYQSDKQEGETINASGYTSDELLNSITGATSISGYSDIIQRKSVSALARISYRYRDEFLMDMSARRDGSSSFGPGNRFGNFGSVGLGWIFTQASWLKNNPLVSFGKLRGSYGITGSQNGSPYAYLASFVRQEPTEAGNQLFDYSTNGAYQGVPAFRLSRTSNTTLGWTKSVNLELGADLYLLKDQRLKFSAQWYQKRTGNQLISQSVSTVTGTPYYLANVPVQVQNTGLEAMIDYTSRQRKGGLSWYVSLNLASNSNRLRSFPGLELASGYYFSYTLGKAINSQELHPTFVDKLTGAYSNVDSSHPVAKPYKVNNYPAFTGGIQTGISYKAFSLSVSCVFAKQKGFTNVQGTAYPGFLPVYAVSNQPASVLQESRWQGPADTDKGGAFHSAAINRQLFDRYWGDASYVSLKNASLTYQVPRALLHNMHISGLNFYVRAENVLTHTFSGYQSMNPEQPGLLQMQAPLRRVIVSGFTINL